MPPAAGSVEAGAGTGCQWAGDISDRTGGAAVWGDGGGGAGAGPPAGGFVGGPTGDFIGRGRVFVPGDVFAGDRSAGSVHAMVGGLGDNGKLWKSDADGRCGGRIDAAGHERDGGG